MSGIDRPEQSLEPIRASLVASFLSMYGPGTGSGQQPSPPRVFAAPGRVNLMGAHVDYNGGPVLPLAVDRYTLVAVRSRDDGRFMLASERASPSADLTLDALPEAPAGEWSDYPLGVARALLARGARSRREKGSGVELLVGGNLPLGAGLSSSASLCLATSCALETCWGLELETRDRIAVALEAEREFVGVHCGILDPFSIALARRGHVLWLETQREVYESLSIELGDACLAVVDSGVRRRLAASAYNQRVEECARAFAILSTQQPGASCLAEIEGETFARHSRSLDHVARARAEHVIGEVARTREARAALEAGSISGLGALMSRTHESLRDSYEVSCAELDSLVQSALLVDGVHGGRLVGAGFGGCAAFLLERSAREAFEERLTSEHRARFGSAPGVWFLRDAGAPREL